MGKQMKKLLGKVLLLLFVLVMLGYTAFTVYMVFGMQKSDNQEQTQVQSEQTHLVCAYAELTFAEVNAVYRDGVQLTPSFTEALLEQAKQEDALALLIEELELESYSTELLRDRIEAEIIPEKEDTVRLQVLDEDQYRAADLCNGVLDILKTADLSEFCGEIYIGDVGIEEK